LEEPNNLRANEPIIEEAFLQVAGREAAPAA
jgi:hypothetical protein